MKTLRRLVAVGLLIGSYHVGMAQSNSIPSFKTEAEKAAWVKAHPELQPKQEIKRNDPNVRSNERFASDAEKQAWIDANPEEYNKMSGKKLQWSSQEEHRAWVESHPEEHKAMLEESMKLEVGKPTNTAARSTERFSTEAEKEAWIKANPEEYEKLNSGKTNK